MKHRKIKKKDIRYNVKTGEINIRGLSIDMRKIYRNIPRAEMNELIERIFHAIFLWLKRGKDVNIKGFGTFYLEYIEGNSVEQPKFEIKLVQKRTLNKALLVERIDDSSEFEIKEE